MPDHKHKQYLQLIAEEINKRLPDNHGFILLAVPYSEDSSTKTINYVSNCQREDAIRLIRRFVVEQGASEIPVGALAPMQEIVDCIEEGVAKSKALLDLNKPAESVAAMLAKTVQLSHTRLKQLIEKLK